MLHWDPVQINTYRGVMWSDLRNNDMSLSAELTAHAVIAELRTVARQAICRRALLQLSIQDVTNAWTRVFVDSMLRYLRTWEMFLKCGRKQTCRSRWCAYQGSLCCQELSFLYLVQCSLFDTNSRRLINVALLSLFVPWKITRFPWR